MDNLEKFIRDNREAFDDRQPPSRIWDELNKALPGAEKKEPPIRRIRLWRGFRVAASVLLLIAVGALLGSYLTSRNFAAEQVAAKLPDDFTEMEQYYQQEVNNKMKILTSTTAVEGEQARLDLEQLDQALAELKADILSAPKGSEEQIINAMILNYKTKIDLLETILERIQANAAAEEEHVQPDSQNIQNDNNNEGIDL
jgi:uncharacterized membrane protein YhiD involved in acid resistance